MSMARWATVIAILVALIADGSIRHPVPSGPTYVVVAPLLSVGGGPTMACNGILLSLPPAGCGGVRLYGVDISQVPGVHRYWNGTIETPSMRLIGVWSGMALTLTQAPRAANPRPASDTVCAATSPAAEPQILRREHQIVNDWKAMEQHGVLLLSIGPCGEALNLLLAVADWQTVNYLTTTYGPVEVSGWLTRVVP